MEFLLLFGNILSTSQCRNCLPSHQDHPHGEDVDQGHEFAVGGAGGLQLPVAVLQLKFQVCGLLLQVRDLVLEVVDVGGLAEPGLAEHLLA